MHLALSQKPRQNVGNGRHHGITRFPHAGRHYPQVLHSGGSMTAERTSSLSGGAEHQRFGFSIQAIVSLKRVSNLPTMSLCQLSSI